MEVGNILAILNNNHNVGRKKQTSLTTSGEKLILKQHYRIAYRKPSKKIIARKFYEPKQFDYFHDMVHSCRYNVSMQIKNTSPPLRKRMAPVERDSRNKYIKLSVQRSRFKK